MPNCEYPRSSKSTDSLQGMYVRMYMHTYLLMSKRMNVHTYMVVDMESYLMWVSLQPWGLLY